MRKEDIRFALDKITPSELQKEAMLREVLNHRKQEKVRMTRLTFAAAAAVVLLCIAVLPPILHSNLLIQNGTTQSGLNSASVDESEDVTLGNTAGNLANDGLAAEDDSYLYYINCADGSSIWRSNKDGSNARKLNSDASSNLNIKDGYIYYINNAQNDHSIHGMKTDGSGDWEIDTVGTTDGFAPVENLIVSGKTLYFLSSGMIYKCDIIYENGFPSARGPTEIKVKGSVHHFTIGGDGKFYYSLIEGEKEVYYALNTINNTAEKLCEGAITESGVNQFCGFLYFSSEDHHLKSYYTDTSNQDYYHYSELTDNFPTCINFFSTYERTVFYSTKNELRLSRKTDKGSTDTLLAKTRAYNINAVSNYVFYTDKNKTSTYRVKTDGSGKVEQLGKRSSADIANNYVTVGDKTYLIVVKQTQVLKPPTPDDKNISIYESAYYGNFDLICYDTDGNQTDRIALNPLFGNKLMGFSDGLYLYTAYYPESGKANFNLGQATATNPPDGATMGYLIFSLDKNGKLENMPVEGNYLYNSADEYSTDMSINSQTVLRANRTGIGQFLYNWDGSKWVIDKTSRGYKNLTQNITSLRASVANEIPQQLLFYDVKDKQITASFIQLRANNLLNGIQPTLTIKNDTKQLEAFTEKLQLKDWRKTTESNVSQPVIKIYLSPNLCFNLHAKTSGVCYASISTRDTTEFYIVPNSVYDAIKQYLYKS